MRVCPQCGDQYPGGEVFCPKDGARIGDPSMSNDIVHRRSAAPKRKDKDPLIGTKIQNRYRIIRQLGEGGMGVVYEAEHVEIEKKMAIKVLRDDFSKKPEVVERFRQEARSASRVGNPHIVDVTDFGQLPDGGVFFAMEMLEGQALDELVTGQSMALERAVPIIDQIARALQAAHDKGIVHRDLKPENIFIVPREEHDFVKILDFGIAKISDRDSEGKRLTQTGMIFGTPEYMSPEQAAGKQLDHRVDVYALGCIMFEMFTGQVPYTGDSFMAILTQHMFEPIPDILEANPDSDLPIPVMNVVYKAMSKDPNTRYSNMLALREDLNQSLIDSEFVVDYPGREQSSSSVFGHMSKTVKATQKISPVTLSLSRRKPFYIGIAAAVAVVLIAGVLFFVFGLTRDDKPQGQNSGGVSKTEPLPEIDDSPLVGSGVSAKTGVSEGDATGSTDDSQNDLEESEGHEAITVSLTSEPEGAIVKISGMGQVCSSTPCSVDIEGGIPVKITAVLDDMEKTAVFTASSQNRELVIALDAPTADGGKISRKAASRKKRSGRRKGRKATRKTKAGGGDNATGLKIPDVFKNN